MKITSIELIRLQGKSASAHGHFSPILVRVATDEGIFGYGEIALAMGQSEHAAAACLRDFAPFVLGQDPFRTEALWDRMHRDSLWAAGGGCVTFGGISGIDIALWDIKAKALNVPLYQLLGGKTRGFLPSYASQLQFGWGRGEAKICASPEALAEEALRAREDGYSCVKFDPIGYSPGGVWKGQDLRGPLPPAILKIAEDRVRAVREAVGPEMALIIENHCLTDTVSAVQLARSIEPYNILFYEEPTEPMNPRLMREIKTQIKIPLATGEKLCNRWRCLDFLEPRAVDVLQPDPGICGGITECKKICDMAEIYDVRIQLHCCHSPISIALALQLECAIPNFLIHETHRSAILPENLELGKYPIVCRDGGYEVPDRPGIGQEPSDWALKHAEVVTIL